MKIEKINDQKVKISLSFEELKNRNVSIDELETNSDKFKNLFLDIINESGLESHFIFDNSQLYIEATYENNDIFTVIITKIDELFDLNNYDVLDTSNVKNIKFKISNNIHNNIYVFNSLHSIKKCAQCINKNDFFIGKNSLYTNNSNYYLTFNKSTLNNKDFNKTSNVLSEFCIDEINSDLLSILISEKYEMLCLNTALKTILNI